ncbi:MAG: SEC-C metal-binding domain-containing protein [Bacteroidales bacterium]|nr:SEC-C metal-binding domain-containing protein [Bacteroidales bacterium]
MHKSKIGRNDPCPCGSGKKHKNCCLGLEGIIEGNEKPFDLYSQLISTIKLKLDQHYSSQIKKMRKSLQDRFLRLCTTHYLPQEQESFFSDWLWFDMTDSEGETFSSEYLRENRDFMEQPLRECLQALNNSYLSIYEPVGIESNGLRVRDFITGQEEQILLKEALDMEIGANRPLLLGRLVALPLGNVFSGMVLMLKNDDGQGEFISKHINYLQKLQEGEELSALLKYNGEILFALFEHANHKALMRLNDIRVVRLENNIPDLIVALDHSEACNFAHETGGIRWYDLRDNLGNARIGVNSEYLISYADILNDVLLMEGLLKKLVPQGNWKIVHSLFLFQPPTPEFDHIWYSVVKDQETERWLHTPHRELDDKTPLDVMEEENGRERLFVMLDSFATQASDNEYSTDLLNYMRLRIK